MNLRHDKTRKLLKDVHGERKEKWIVFSTQMDLRHDKTRKLLKYVHGERKEKWI